MMKNDNLKQLFGHIKTDFDLETPNQGHEKRFMEKLQANQQTSKRTTVLWKPFIGIAATLALVFTLVLIHNSKQNKTSLASVSPEMAKAESFFTSTISSELKKLNHAENTETKLIIKDAMIQLNKLEYEYEQLKTDLTKSGKDQRVIYAMISNFQSRITILQNTLKQIELRNQLKNSNYETNNTL